MTQDVRENRMGTQKENSLLLSMAIPMMISMLVQALYNVVDTMFVSGLGQDALNALSLAFPVQNLIIAVSVGTGVGMNALLSKSLGEKDFDKANKAANMGILLEFISSAVVMLLGIFFAETYFKLYGASDSVVKLGKDYLSICMILSMGVFMQVIFEKHLQSTGKTKLSMATQLVGAIANIILDPIMIYGFAFIPAMGVTGAALATVTGQIIAAFLGLYLNVKYNKEITLSVKGVFSPDKAVIKRIYAVGVPSILMASIGSVMTFCMNQIVRVFDSATAATAQTVFGIYFKLQSFIFMPVFGLNNGMVPIIAYNFGARKPDRIKKTIKLSIMYAVIIMLIGLCLFQFVPDKLLLIFDTGDDDMATILKIGCAALRAISISYLFAGFCIIASSVFQAMGKGFLSLVVSVCRQLVVLIPAAFIIAITTHDVNLVWYSFPIAEIASLILCATFMKQIYKNEINTL